jgi:hypothetical protein
MTRLAVTAAVAVGFVGGCAHGAEPRPTEVSGRPVLALDCHGPKYPCHRLYVAVWLDAPARTVRATLDGHSVTLRTGRGTGAYRRQLFWQGSFNDPDAERFCAEFPHSLAVAIGIAAEDGSPLIAETSAPVSCGHG